MKTQAIAPHSVRSPSGVCPREWVVAVALVSRLLGHCFPTRVFPSWLRSHPLNMYLKHEELKRGDNVAQRL